MLRDRVLFVGIGQCGNNLTKELETLGYNTFYINTSYDDLKPLKTDDNRIYHIPNAKGCAKDREKATSYAVGYYEDILNLIDTKFPTFDIVYFIYSTGGGTGGGISNILLDTISFKNPNKFYGAVVVLPHKSESILVHANAKESLKQLIDIKDKLYSIHILDNNKRDDFEEINQEFAILFDRFVSFNETTKKGNIDGEEIEKLATDSGITVMLEFDNDDFQMGLAESINNSIYADWNSDCNYLGLILSENNNKLKCLEYAQDEFGMPITDFTTFSSEGNLIVATGMSFNMLIPRQLTKIANEKLKRKQELEIANEIEDEDDVEISMKALNKNKKNSKKKPLGKENSTKELNSIIDKYRNM